MAAASVRQGTAMARDDDTDQSHQDRIEGTAETFGERLNDLPQEMYDMMFEMTFTATSGIVRMEPPWPWSSIRGPKISLGPMQVSRATRAQFGRSHYENSTYVFSDPETCKNWILAMPKAHLLLLRDLRCIREPEDRHQALFGFGNAGQEDIIRNALAAVGNRAVHLDFDYVMPTQDEDTKNEHVD